MRASQNYPNWMGKHPYKSQLDRFECCQLDGVKARLAPYNEAVR